MKEYKLRIIENPISNKLPELFLIKCNVAPGTAVGSGKNNIERELTAVSEAIEWDTMYLLQEDVIAPFLEKNELMINPSYFGHLNITNLKIDWIYATNHLNQKFLLHRPTRSSDRASLYNHTSNGIAVHNSAQNARETAFREIIERAYVALFWKGQREAVRLNNIYSDFYMDVITNLGWKTDFYSIGNKEYNVVVSITSNDLTRSIAMGFGCSDNLRNAAQGAFYEGIQTLEAFILGGVKYLSKNQRYFFQDEGVDLLYQNINTGANKDDVSVKKENVYFREKETMGLYYAECFISHLPINYDNDRKECLIWPI